MCEDISIADDFDVRLGVVSGGVSLLIRPAETKPKSPDMFQTAESHMGLLFLAFSKGGGEDSVKPRDPDRGLKTR